MEIVLSRLKVIVEEEFSGPLKWDARRAMKKMTDDDIERAISDVLTPFNRKPQGHVLFALGVCLAANRIAVENKLKDVRIKPADINSAMRRYFPERLTSAIRTVLWLAPQSRVSDNDLAELADLACATVSKMPQEHLLVGTLFALAFTIDYIAKERELMELNRRHEAKRQRIAVN
jgi:hypothetical protein